MIMSDNLYCWLLRISLFSRKVEEDDVMEFKIKDPAIRYASGFISSRENQDCVYSLAVILRTTRKIPKNF